MGNGKPRDIWRFTANISYLGFESLVPQGNLNNIACQSPLWSVNHEPRWEKREAMTDRTSDSHWPFHHTNVVPTGG